MWVYCQYQLTKAIGEHFNQPGYSLADMSVTAKEQVRVNITLKRKGREKYVIRMFDTYTNGLNKNT